MVRKFRNVVIVWVDTIEIHGGSLIAPEIPPWTHRCTRWACSYISSVWWWGASGEHQQEASQQKSAWNNVTPTKIIQRSVDSCMISPISRKQLKGRKESLLDCYVRGSLFNTLLLYVLVFISFAFPSHLPFVSFLFFHLEFLTFPFHILLWWLGHLLRMVSLHPFSFKLISNFSFTLISMLSVQFH